MADHGSGKETVVRRSGSVRLARDHPVFVFYLLAFAISWGGFLPGMAGARGAALFQNPWWLALLILPAMGPGLAAAVAAWLAGDGQPARRRLRRAMTRRQVGPGWWLVAGLARPALLLTANGVSRWWLPRHAADSPPAPIPALIALVAVSLFANPWEEIGWRGFALRRLQERWTPLMATLVVGVLWALWHVPLFLWPGSGMAGDHFWSWAAGLMGNCLIVTWLYNRSAQSLLPVILFHVKANLSGGLLGVDSYAVLAVVQGVAAFAVLGATGESLGLRRDDREDASG